MLGVIVDRNNHTPIFHLSVSMFQRQGALGFFTLRRDSYRIDTHFIDLVPAMQHVVRAVLHDNSSALAVGFDSPRFELHIPEGQYMAYIDQVLGRLAYGFGQMNIVAMEKHFGRAERVILQALGAKFAYSIKQAKATTGVK